jgi:hypothetical protein
VTWKVLAGLLLTLPPVAYVAGTLVGPPEPPTGDSAVTVPESPATSSPSGPRPTESARGDTAGGPAWEPRPPEVLGTQAQRPSEPSSPRAQRSEEPTERQEPETTPTPSQGATTAPGDQTSPTPGDPGEETPDDPSTATPPEPTATPTDGGGEGDTEPGA